jgi:hypothetical protein
MKKFIVLVVVSLIVWMVIEHWDSIRSLFNGTAQNNGVGARADKMREAKIEAVIGKTLVKLQLLGLIDTI